MNIDLKTFTPSAYGYGWSIGANEGEEELSVFYSGSQSLSGPLIAIAASIDGGLRVIEDALTLPHEPDEPSPDGWADKWVPDKDYLDRCRLILERWTIPDRLKWERRKKELERQNLAHVVQPYPTEDELQDIRNHIEHVMRLVQEHHEGEAAAA